MPVANITLATFLYTFGRPTVDDRPFEGPDHDWVGRAQRAHLWTLVECDGRLYMMEGVHFVNRVCVLWTRKARSIPADVLGLQYNVSVPRPAAARLGLLP